MRSRFRNGAPVQNDNLVGIFHRAQAVGDQNHRPQTEKIFQIGENFFFVYGVQGVGRFIPEKIVRIFVNRPSDENPLFLPLAQPLPGGPDHGPVTQRQRDDKVVDVGQPGRPGQFLFVCRPGRKSDVRGHRVGKNETILQNQAAFSAPGAFGDIRERDAADQ